MIRKADKKDSESIAKLHLELIKHLKKANPNRYVLNGKWKKSFINKLKHNLKDKDAVVFVYEKDNEIIGFGIGRIKNHPHFVKYDKFLEISEIVIAPKHQRKGIGIKIAKKMVDFFKKRGIKSAELFVDLKNKTAINAWKKLGFEEITKGMIKEF